jgi:hypothetical protein
MRSDSHDEPSAAFQTSLMARGAMVRLAYAAAIVAGLWLAILWAVSLP